MDESWLWLGALVVWAFFVGRNFERASVKEAAEKARREQEIIGILSPLAALAYGGRMTNAEVQKELEEWTGELNDAAAQRWRNMTDRERLELGLSTLTALSDPAIQVQVASNRADIDAVAVHWRAENLAKRPQ